MIQLNKIYNEDCLITLKNIPDNTIDLTVTSPPYDDLRTYNNHISGKKTEFNGYSFDFESIAKELYRTTKDGGVVVWVVGDGTEKGSETGTSFRQALYFKEIGFNIHDTMIYMKNNFSNPSSTRYHQIFEYMFVLSKGKPRPLIQSRTERTFTVDKSEVGVKIPQDKLMGQWWKGRKRLLRSMVRDTTHGHSRHPKTDKRMK